MFGIWDRDERGRKRYRETRAEITPKKLGREVPEIGIELRLP